MTSHYEFLFNKKVIIVTIFIIGYKCIGAFNLHIAFLLFFIIIKFSIDIDICIKNSLNEDKLSMQLSDLNYKVIIKNKESERTSKMFEGKKAVKKKRTQRESQ